MVSGFGSGPTLQARLSLDPKAFKVGLKDAESRLGGFNQKLKAARLPLLAVTGTLTALGGVSIKAASDLQQSVGAVESVFGSAADKVLAFGKTAVDSLGLSAAAFNESILPLSAQLKNAGLDVDEVADRMFVLSQRSADLAATFGGTTEDAIRAVGSAFRGELDPIEKYGVSVKEADVQARAMALGLTNAAGDIDKNGRALATMQLILEQTTDVQGQFAKEAGTAAVQTQKLQARMANLSAELGTKLLPAAERVLDWADKLFTWFSDLPDEVKTFTVALAGVTLGFAALGLIIPPAIALMTTFGVVSNVALAGIPLLIAGIIAGVTLLIMKWDEVVEFMKGTGGWILAAFGPIGVAAKLVIDNFDEIREAVKAFFNFFVESVNNFIDKTNQIIRAMNKVAGIFGQAIPEIEWHLSRWEDKVEDLSYTHDQAEREIGESLEDLGSHYVSFADTATEEMDRVNEKQARMVENVRHLSQEEADAIGLGVTRRILMGQIFRHAREGDLEHEEEIVSDLIDLETEYTGAVVTAAGIRMGARNEEFNTLRDIISGLPSRFGPGLTAQGTLDPIKGFFDKDRADRFEADRKADELEKKLAAGDFKDSGMFFQDAEGNTLSHEQQIRAEIKRLRKISGGNLSGPGLDNFARLMVERAGAAPPMLPGMQGGIGAGGIAAGGGAGGVSVTVTVHGDIHRDDVERVSEAVNEGVRRGMIQEQETIGG